MSNFHPLEVVGRGSETQLGQGNSVHAANLFNIFFGTTEQQRITVGLVKRLFTRAMAREIAVALFRWIDGSLVTLV